VLGSTKAIKEALARQVLSRNYMGMTIRELKATFANNTVSKAIDEPLTPSSIGFDRIKYRTANISIDAEFTQQPTRLKSRKI
jgi:hypothetical protein